MKEYNLLLKKALVLTGKLQKLATESYTSQDDYELLMLCARLQEIAGELDHLTRKEIRCHRERGIWE